jgi:glycosyltransferase involved in cell wall biosynthesis
VKPVGYLPFGALGIGSTINSILSAIPILRWFGLAQVLVLRPILPDAKNRSLSVVIPARNERGNIENALKRLEGFRHCELEIIFVEGHSTDGTWEEIERLIPLYQYRFKIVKAQQKGKGKADAVRLGFSLATNDLLTVLDADLTMPPEHLERFYLAYARGLGDFVNGSRLVYPMEGEAMRFLNWLGNIFFAKALSSVLDVTIGDSLCGTKLLSRRDYQRFSAWRADFGEFDPFGDFELIFPAAIFGLGIVDVPVRYLARTYGSTSIHRFYHGWILLKMTLTGLLRIKITRLRRS